MTPEDFHRTSETEVNGMTLGAFTLKAHKEEIAKLAEDEAPAAEEEG